MTASAGKTVALRKGVAQAVIALRGAEALAWSAGGRNLLWTPDPAFWSDVSPLLFPVVGWTRLGQARVAGRLYPLALHGFARLLDYDVLAQGADFLRLGISDTALTRALYPFAFAFEAEYRLSAHALEMRMTVVNCGALPMPYACGFHPGFRWPFACGEQTDYRITFEAVETGWVPNVAPGGLIGTTSKQLALQGRELPLTPRLFANDALCFLNAASKGLRFAGPDAAIDMTTENLAHIALWMRPGGQYLCLEPWSGHSDPEGFTGDLFEKPSMQVLAPGTSGRHAARFALVE